MYVKVFFSTYNKKELSDSFEKVSQIYPYLVKEENLWKTNLENGNPEVHPGPTLLNVGRIDYAIHLPSIKKVLRSTQ